MFRESKIFRRMVRANAFDDIAVEIVDGRKEGGE